MSEEKRSETIALREVHEEFTITSVRESYHSAQREALFTFSLLTGHVAQHECLIEDVMMESRHVLGLPAYSIHGSIRGTPEHMAHLLKGELKH